MHAAVKPLQWLDNFCDSVSGALGSGISHHEKESTNPMIKLVTFEFQDHLSGRSFLHVWNLLQYWAAVNNCAPQGKVEKEGRKMTVKMATKHKFGLAKVHHPLGDKK